MRPSARRAFLRQQQLEHLLAAVHVARRGLAARARSLAAQPLVRVRRLPAIVPSSARCLSAACEPRRAARRACACSPADSRAPPPRSARALSSRSVDFARDAHFERLDFLADRLERRLALASALGQGGDAERPPRARRPLPRSARLAT